MSSLKGFLAQNALKSENEKYVASKRFVDDNGNPLEWEIKGISSKEDEILRKSCMKRVKTRGKQTTTETDINLYLGKLAVECTVYPDLNNKELQDSYGVMGADTLLKTMLLPGEYSDYIDKVQEVNGFDVTFEEKVEEAKN